MVEAPDRAAEVREALRWLKERIVRDGMKPSEVALLAREAGPYRIFATQTAAEFGMPIHIADGMPLGQSTVIVALLDLLRLMLPVAAEGGGPALPRKGVVAAWRSPYFDWAGVTSGISPADADALDAAGRWGRVIGGLGQWNETLQALAGREASVTPGRKEKLPAGVVTGAEANALEEKFSEFRGVIEPPRGKQPYRRLTNWLRWLIGFDSDEPRPAGQGSEPVTLNVIERIRENDSSAVDSPTVGMDAAALNELGVVLRDMVWVDEQERGVSEHSKPATDLIRQRLARPGLAFQGRSRIGPG
jgi:hypothetical protein